MNMRGKCGIMVRAGAVVAIAAGTAQAGQVWQRASNWVPGSTAGTTANNPGPVNGSPAWQYEYTQGGGLGSANEWFKQPTQLMTWDPAWYATGWGVWSKGNNQNPPVLPSRLVHNVHPTTFGDIPVVRWLNPMGAATTIGLNGTMTVNWNGANGLGRPVNVDVVIAKHSAQTNTTSILFSTTVSKPNPFPSVGDSVLLPISLANVAISPGDSILFSHRGQTSVGPLGAWVNLYDNVSITAVPAPGAAALLGMAGLLAARRKRR